MYIQHHRLARAACAYWRASDEGGCDQPILLGQFAAVSQIADLASFADSQEMIRCMAASAESLRAWMTYSHAKLTPG